MKKESINLKLVIQITFRLHFVSEEYLINLTAMILNEVYFRGNVYHLSVDYNSINKSFYWC